MTTPPKYAQFSVGRYFGVSILTEEQEDLSSRFANHAITDRFENLPYDRGQTGVPLLPNSLAWLECRITEAYPGGDHTIFLGAVERAATSAGRPLAFYRGRYARLAPEAEK